MIGNGNEQRTAGQCLFTGQTAEIWTVFSGTNYQRYLCPASGEYLVSADVVALIEKLGSIGHTQGHINCAKKVIAFGRSNPNEILLFVTAPYRQMIQQDLESTRANTNHGHNWRLVTLEEFFESAVDHSSKPTEFLQALATQVQNRRAYETFKFARKLMYLAGIVDNLEAGRILGYLHDEKLIQITNASGSNDRELREHIGRLDGWIDNAQMFITPHGWAHLKNLNSFPNTNKVFIATQFKWDKNKPFKREDATGAIVRACAKLGYEASPVTQDHHGYITDKIISQIKESRFAVCEFTYHNKGVYFEAGFARGLGRPVFHVVHKDYAKKDKDAPPDKKMHFDIEQIQYRSWKTPAELESVLYNWIESTEGRYGEKKSRE